jgi:hypothetical protein
MNQESSTPEDVVLGFSFAELMELLGDLGLESNIESARRFRQLVRSLGDVDQALEVIVGSSQRKRAG